MTNPTTLSEHAPIAVIGAGIMGTGIAQVAAQHGHPVTLFDNRPDAARQAVEKLAHTLRRLQEKGKLSADEARGTLARITVADQLSAVAGAALVVEAIVENADVKRALFREVEAQVPADCILASNTSSISITRIAQGLQHPGRVVGMHFFNPVPLMRLVEVVCGLQTDPATAQAITDLSQTWGKSPVRARSTPGFIVNRIARPFYAETFALLQETAGTPEALDACLRAAGFRMGPCELTDLIGHDTNFAVTSSVYAANFYDKRFVPSLVQRELVEGGLLGRKSGRGFYAYAADGVRIPGALASPAPSPDTPPHRTLQLAGCGHFADLLQARLQTAGLPFTRLEEAGWTGLIIDGARQLRLTDGRTASELGAEVAVFDLPMGSAPQGALAFAVSVHAGPDWAAQAAAWLQVLGFAPVALGDAPGLVVARTLAMLVNEAADAVQQGVCSQADADTAMKLGTNYPAGPFEWLRTLGAPRVIRVLDALDAHYRGERYRTSPWLRLRA